MQGFTTSLLFDRIDIMAKSPVVFLKEVQAELGKVIWPGRNEVIRLTIVVLLVSLIVGLFIGALDFVFTKIFSFLIGG